MFHIAQHNILQFVKYSSHILDRTALEGCENRYLILGYDPVFSFSVPFFVCTRIVPLVFSDFNV
jgi:hypothetical protein